MADLGSLEAQSSMTRSPIEVPEDMARLVGGVNLNKLIIQRPLLDNINKFDPKTANLFASEKKWDELKGYLGQFASQDSDDVVNLFIQYEQHIIELVKDVKYVAALSAFKDEIIPSIRASACNDMIKPLTNHLLFLQGQVELSMSSFDRDITNAFITKKDLKGLKEYLNAFINSNPHDEEDHNHTGLMLTLYELELIEAAEGHNLDLAIKIFEEKIKPLKALSNDEMFRHVGFLRRIRHIESSLKSLKDFDVEYKRKKMPFLFDLLQSYFSQQLRLLIESDKSLFQFVYKGNAPAPPCCLACDWVITASKGQKYFEHHAEHSEGCKELKINGCDDLTRYLPRQVNACKKFKEGETSSVSAAMLALTKPIKLSLEKKESGHRGKRRKVIYESESCSLSDRVSIVGSHGKDDESSSAENELPEDDAAVVIGSVLTKHVDLRRDLANLDNSVSAGVAAICKEQTDIIFDIQHLICQQPLDSDLALDHVYTLETKNTEFFPFIDVLPSAVRKKILEFFEITVKLRSVFMKPSYGRAVPSPPVFKHATELVRINLDINMMIKPFAVGSGDKFQEIYDAHCEEVLKIVKVFNEHKVDVKSICKLVSSISDVNDRLIPLFKVLPGDLPLKLAEMHAVICKLRCLCLEKSAANESLL